MRRMRVTWRPMPPRMVTAPPESPVPAPRGTTGILCFAATFMTRATCSVVEARTTASGTAPSIDPSRSKMRRSFAESMTDSRPTIRRSSATTASGSTLEDLETTGRRAWKARSLCRPGADDGPVEPGTAFVVRRDAVLTLEHRLLDAAVGRDLDGVPDGEAVGSDGVMRLVDSAIDREPHRLRLRGGAQPGSFARDVHEQLQFKLELDDRPAASRSRPRDGCRRPPAGRGVGPHVPRGMVAWRPGRHHRRTCEAVRLGFRQVSAAREHVRGGVWLRLPPVRAQPARAGHDPARGPGPGCLDVGPAGEPQSARRPGRVDRHRRA